MKRIKIRRGSSSGTPGIVDWMSEAVPSTRATIRVSGGPERTAVVFDFFRFIAWRPRAIAIPRHRTWACDHGQRRAIARRHCPRATTLWMRTPGRDAIPNQAGTADVLLAGPTDVPRGAPRIRRTVADPSRRELGAGGTQRTQSTHRKRGRKSAKNGRRALLVGRSESFFASGLRPSMCTLCCGCSCSGPYLPMASPACCASARLRRAPTIPESCPLPPCGRGDFTPVASRRP